MQQLLRSIAAAVAVQQATASGTDSVSALQ